MINTIDIGKYIYSRLTEAGIKVYPLIADNDAKYPFAIYERTNLYYDESKDGIYRETAVVSIKVITDKYSTSIEVANKVRDVLDLHRQEFKGYLIDDCHLTGASEEYNSGAFIQYLEFTIRICG